MLVNVRIPAGLQAEQRTLQIERIKNMGKGNPEAKYHGRAKYMLKKSAPGMEGVPRYVRDPVVRAQILVDARISGNNYAAKLHGVSVTIIPHIAAQYETDPEFRSVVDNIRIETIKRIQDRSLDAHCACLTALQLKLQNDGPTLTALARALETISRVNNQHLGDTAKSAASVKSSEAMGKNTPQLSIPFVLTQPRTE
jgi:hypothetical protein